MAENRRGRTLHNKNEGEIIFNGHLKVRHADAEMGETSTEYKENSEGCIPPK